MAAQPHGPGAAARDIATVLREPLEHDVTAEAVVREAPSHRSPEARRLQAGQVVRGYPAGRWLLLADGEVAGQSPGWAPISHRGGGAALQLLVARWAGIRVERSFFEALELSWPGIPGDFVAYSVQWRPRDTATRGSPTSCASSPDGRAADTGSSSGGEGLLGASGGAGGTTECTSPWALLHGLPADSPLRVRVVASVSGPEVDFAELLVSGPWVDVKTDAPWVDVKTDAPSEALPDRDMLGVRRSGCERTGCAGFVAAASFYEGGAEQCRRCGASHEEHLTLECPQPDAALEASAPEDGDQEEDEDEVEEQEDEGAEARRVAECAESGSSVADQDASFEPNALGEDLLGFAAEAPGAAGAPDAGAGATRAVAAAPETGEECLRAAGGPSEWWEGSGQEAGDMDAARDDAALETDEECLPVDGDSAAWWEGSDEGAVGEVAPESLPPEVLAEAPGVASAALYDAGACAGPQEGPEDWAEEDDISAQAMQDGSWDDEHGAGDSGPSLGAAREDGLEAEAAEEALAEGPIDGAGDVPDEAAPFHGGGTEPQEVALRRGALLRPRAWLGGPWFLLPSVGTWRGAFTAQARAAAAAPRWPPGGAAATEAMATPSVASGGALAAAAPPALEPPSAKVGLSAAAADNAQRVLGRPVEYVVTKAGGAVAREEPHKAARERAVLEAGSLVAGFPGGGWLRIAQAQPPDVAGCWVFVGSQLAAVALQPQVAARFGEALELKWPGLRNDLVGYSVEWRPVGQPPAEVALPSSRARVSLKPVAIASGIPAALARVQVRVGARVCAPPAAGAGASDVQLLGAWSEEEALAAPGAPGSLPEGPHLDPFSAPRGACLAAGCPGYVPMRFGAGAPQRGAPRVEDAARCWRCGHSCREHALAGGGGGRAAARPEPKGAAKEAAAVRPEPRGAEKEQSLALALAAPPGTRSYEVVHNAVHVRDQPSRQGRSIGVVREGQTIAGAPSSGWLQLDEASRAAAVPHGSQQQPAWCLIDGSELGLGLLLRAVGADAAEGGGAEAPPAGRAVEGLADIRSALRGQPLELRVASATPVAVHEEPRESSRLIATLQPEATVRGFPAGGWAFLDGPGGGWVRVLGGREGSGPALAATWAELSLRRAFEQALRLEWPGLGGGLAASYSVEWRPPSQQDPAGSQRVPRRSPGAARESTTVHGLPEGSPVAVRVVAALPAGAGPSARLEGHWAELATARPSSSEDGSDTPRNVDPLGVPRHRCVATGCSGYKAARSRHEVPAGALGGGDPELCGRCGAHFSSHDAAPALTLAAAAEESGASGGEAGEWEVVARGVFVRDRPSTGGAQVAALSRGQPLSGELLPSGWVSLDAGCRGRLSIASEEAFVLTHGEAAGMPQLGALLERVEPGLSGATGAGDGGAIEEYRAADGAAGEQDAKGSAESVQRCTSRAAEVLRGRPLSFLVVSAEGPCVRERPVAGSPPRGGLQPGDLVRGFPGSGWLLISGGDLDGRWAPIGGGPRGATTLLEAQWSRVAVRRSFMEAAIVEWPGLDPAEYPEITYAVEWRPEGEGGASQRRVTKRAHAHITGLPRGSVARLRVLACVPGQHNSQAPLRLNGAWADVPTAEHARESRWLEEELDSTDPLGGARAGCPASKCVRYAAPEDKTSYLNDFSSVLCRRCGVAFAKHLLRAGAVRAAQGVAQPSPGAPSKYVVQHFAVILRSEPSLQADKLGALCRGDVVRGRVVDGWLEICREDCERYSGRAGRAAYALVDGKAIGLGALLAPWKEGDPLPGDDSGEEQLPPVGHRMQDVYTGGVPFLAARVAAVRRKPEAASRLLATLEKGELVQGLARGAWVQLDLKQEALADRRLPGGHGWCKSEPKDPGAGPLLRCTLLDVQVAASFAEALSVKWTRVPAKLVRYSVEWMLKDDPDAVVHVAETSCKGCSLRVGGLQAGTAYLVRVIAQVLRPRNEAAGGSALHKPGMYRVAHQRGIRVSAEFARDSKALARLSLGTAVNVLEVAAESAQGRVRGRIESPAGWISIFNVQNNAHGARRALELDPEGPFARIVGGWCEGSTGPEVTKEEESNKTWDPLAKTRGACLDCGHCKSYVISKYTFAQRLEDVMCRRCGCPCTRHRVVGDWQGGTAEDRAWAAHQARIREARLALARKPVIHCRQWSADQAAAGDEGVRFIVKNVSGANHLYEMLGVANNAGAPELRKAYRKISLRIHPDKVKSEEPELLKKAEASFKKVATAYATLGDAGKRAAYDRELASKVPARPPPEPEDDQTGARRKQKAPASKSVKEVELKIVQAITSDEVTLRMPPGSTVLAVKRALSKHVRRGPEDRLELAFLDGAGMSDDFCLDQSFTLWCVGVDLGPPRPVDVLIRDVWTGAYGSVEVLDTDTMSEVKSKVAASFDVDEGSIAIGLSSPKVAARGAGGFEELPGGARLDGRRALHVRGAKPVVYLTLEQGTELQRELVEAYSAPEFQTKLDELEAAWPMPQSLGKQKFRAEFGALVKAAQRDTLQRWGFEGEFAAHDMITAFKRIGDLDEVWELTAEIDRCLRFTRNGGIGPAKQAQEPEPAEAPEAQAEEPPEAQDAAPQRVVVTVRQAVVQEGVPSPPVLRMEVPAGVNVEQLRAAIAERLGLGRVSEVKLVFRLRESRGGEVGMSFASYKDKEPIGARREFLMLGASLSEKLGAGGHVEPPGQAAQAPELEPAGAQAREASEALAAEEVQAEEAEPELVEVAVKHAVVEEGRPSPPELRLEIPAGANVEQLRARIAERLGLRRASQAKLVFRLGDGTAGPGGEGAHFASYKDKEPVGSRREFLMFGVNLWEKLGAGG